MKDLPAPKKLGHARTPLAIGGSGRDPLDRRKSPSILIPFHRRSQDRVAISISRSPFRRMFSLYPAGTNLELRSVEYAFSAFRRSLAPGPRSSNSWAVRPRPGARVAISFPSPDSIAPSAMMAFARLQASHLSHINAEGAHLSCRSFICPPRRDGSPKLTLWPVRRWVF